MEKEPISGNTESIITYHGKAGTNIDDGIKEMIALAKSSGGKVQSSINGIVDLVVDENSDFDKTFAEVMIEIDKDHKKREEASEKRYESEKREAEPKIRILIESLSGLDFKNEEALLDWIYDFEKVSNYAENVDNEKIFALFIENGYQSDANAGEALDRHDKNSHARYIIGQALSCLKAHKPILQMIPEFIKEWKAEFIAKKS